MTQYRVGIVGCGEAAQILHLPSLYQLQDKFTVTALCDVSQSVVEGVGEVWRVPNRFLDYRDLVARNDVDIVLIANPNAYHAEVALAAIEAGKHVLIEKPMCITLRENDAIIAARDKAGVVVQVGTMRRYAPAFVEACERVRKLDNICLARVHDVLGRNALIIEPTSHVIRGKDIPEAVLAAAAARNDELVLEAIGDVPPAVKAAYNLLLSLSTHDTSAMRELLGLPKGVLYAAQRQNGMYMTAAFDYGDYICHFETGVDSIPRFDACLEVYSPEQVVRVDYDTPYVRNLPIRLKVTAAEGAGAAEHNIHPAWGDAFKIEWEALYDNITYKRLPKTSPEDFRQDLELYARMIQLMC
jgi:predicted dehydrogenase